MGISDGATTLAISPRGLRTRRATRYEKAQKKVAKASQVARISLLSRRRSARLTVPTVGIDEVKPAVVSETKRQIGVTRTPSASTPASQSVIRASRPRPSGRKRAGRKPSLRRTKPSPSRAIATGEMVLASVVMALNTSPMRPCSSQAPAAFST